MVHLRKFHGTAAEQALKVRHHSLGKSWLQNEQGGVQADEAYSLGGTLDGGSNFRQSDGNSRK